MNCQVPHSLLTPAIADLVGLQLPDRVAAGPAVGVIDGSDRSCT